ncbi:MAG: BrnT family toxin [Rhizobiales bacterium]|jgi:uncharacterized DUF497 family protein|nr:BrnT family toxin [Hyphomicrobiales bacterium]
MRFEWDERKNALNLAKHGISFEEACLIFEGPVVSRTDDRTDYGEQREVSIGAIGDIVVVTVVHTDREGVIRLISARLANRRERRLYDEYIRQAAQGTRGSEG